MNGVTVRGKRCHRLFFCVSIFVESTQNDRSNLFKHNVANQLIMVIQHNFIEMYWKFSKENDRTIARLFSDFFQNGCPFLFGFGACTLPVFSTTKKKRKIFSQLTIPLTQFPIVLSNLPFRLICAFHFAELKVYENSCSSSR